MRTSLWVATKQDKITISQTKHDTAEKPGVSKRAIDEEMKFKYCNITRCNDVILEQIANAVMDALIMKMCVPFIMFIKFNSDANRYGSCCTSYH